MTGLDFVTQIMTQKQMLHRHVLSASDARKKAWTVNVCWTQQLSLQISHEVLVLGTRDGHSHL